MTTDSLPDIGTLEQTTIGGLKVRYARSGLQAGLPIVLTAPWPESIYAFHRVLPHLAGEHPLIAVDLPGFGLSESRPDVMSPSAMGDFVVALLAHFNIERAHVVAPDVGALAVLFAASRHPALFESLALGGAGTRVDLVDGALKQLMETPPGALSEVDGAVAMKDYLDYAAQLSPAAVVEDFKAASAGRRLENATQYVRSYLTELASLETLLPSIKVPTLVIAGQNDTVVPPANNEVLVAGLPHNRYVLLNGGHRIWEEATDPFAVELAAWFGGGYRQVGSI